MILDEIMRHFSSHFKIVTVVSDFWTVYYFLNNMSCGVVRVEMTIILSQRKCEIIFFKNEQQTKKGYHWSSTLSIFILTIVQNFSRETILRNKCLGWTNSLGVDFFSWKQFVMAILVQEQMELDTVLWLILVHYARITNPQRIIRKAAVFPPGTNHGWWHGVWTLDKSHQPPLVTNVGVV